MKYFLLPFEFSDKILLLIKGTKSKNMETQTCNTAIYRQFIDTLHENDTGKYIELPQISVMGDTSSGKSSLLSAISGIEFPANDKITTRCPVRLRMEASRKGEPFKAKVFVKWHTSSNQLTEFQTKHLNNINEIPSAVMEAQECIFRTAGKQVNKSMLTYVLTSSRSKYGVPIALI
jgi:ATPase subunit of ABC transporter with duplicated ATPase domains